MAPLVGGCLQLGLHFLPVTTHVVNQKCSLGKHESPTAGDLCGRFLKEHSFFNT